MAICKEGLITMPIDANATSQPYSPDVTPADFDLARPALAPDDAVARLADLEAAARAALDAITTDAANRLSQAVDRAETRVMEALSLMEHQQREAHRWRDDLDERLRAQMRELGEWDETLTEMRHEIVGLREMAEASVSLASGDLDQRWDAMRRELGDILATAESDERARWEAFMAGAADTLAAHSGIDPTELATVRADLANLSATAATTVARLHEAQREQVAALRSEVHSLLESERNRAAAALQERLEEARGAFLAQTQTLRDWQEQVGRDVAALRQAAAAAERDVHAAKADLLGGMEGTLAALRGEIANGIAQAKIGAQNEVQTARAETERLVRRAHGQSQGRQSFVLLLALLALLVAVGALALPFVWHH
jgi:hypothetical protein